MADLGTIVAKLGLDPSQLLAGVNSAKAALQSASKAMGDLESNAAQAFRTLQASDLGKNIRQLAQDCAQAAERADDLRDGLNGAFRDSAPAVAGFIESIGTAKGVLSDESLAAAAKTLQNLGAFSEDALVKVADQAAATGKSVEGLAEAFGRFNKFADAKSVLGYQKAIGASSEELRLLGATIDDNDKLLVDNEERLNAARVALEKFSDTKFSGALDAVSDDSAKLTGELELLKREVGASTFALKENLDSALLPFVQGLREASPEVKAVAGVTAELASGAGSAVPQIVAMASQLKILGVTVSATVASLAAMVAIVAAAAAGFALYINELNKTNKAEEDFLAQQEKTARALATNKGLIGKSADELKKMGKTSKDLVPILQGLQDQLQQARNVDPNSAATKGLEAKIKEFKKTKDDLARIDLSTKQATEPGKVEKSVKEQAAADEKARKEKKAKDEKDARDKATAAEKARKESVDIALDEIKRKAAAREIDKAQEIAALQQVLKEQKLTASEKRDIQQQIANLTGQILDKEASDNKARSDKAKQQAEKDAEQLRNVKKAGFDQQIKDAELALKRLDEEEKRGADVTIKRQAEIAKKVAAEKAKIDLQAEADKAKTTSGAVKAAITKQATGDKSTVDKTAAAEADKISKERKDNELKDRQEELDFNLEIQQKKVDALKQLAEAGAVSSQQVKTALEQQLAIQLQLIEAQKQQALAATTDPTKIAQANKRAEIQVAEAKAATRKEIEATTQALKAQQEQQKSATYLDLGGNQQSLEEFFKSQQGFFDLTKSKDATTKDFRAISEQQGLLRTLGTDAPLSKSATDAAKASIPFKTLGSQAAGAGQGTAAGGPQSLSTTVNHNSVNGTSIDDPALGRKIEEIVRNVVKSDQFKRGNG